MTEHTPDTSPERMAYILKHAPSREIPFPLGREAILDLLHKVLELEVANKLLRDEAAEIAIRVKGIHILLTEWSERRQEAAT